MDEGMAASALRIVKEPVGTHGLFKCIFSAPISQSDTIMLIIFKRVYPKMVANEVKIW